MMRLLILALLAFVCNDMMGMNIGRDTINDQEVIQEERVLEDSIPESFMEKLDYYYNSWYASRRDSVEYVDSAFVLANRNIAVPCDDSIYLLRLDSLQSAVPLSYNGIVKNYIEMYTVKRRSQVAAMLGASEYYFPIFEEALDAACLPMELKYLPIIESALNPRALSKAGACGLWQFMYSTGKMYKLEINSYIDERRDPVLATKAAVQYLSDLYGIFIAAVYTFNYYKQHGIYPLESNLPTMCDSIMVSEALHFDQIAKNLDLSVEELRDLNPQYRADIVPAGFGKSYALKMPYNHVNAFIDNQDTIFACDRSKYFNDSDRTADPNQRFKVHAKALGTEGRARMVYTVKSGDVPGAIANRFNVKTADLKYWNNLNKRMTIRPGQKLVIYVPEKKAAEYKKNATYTGKESNQVSAPKIETIDGEFVYHTVRKGENLWLIAKKYPGVSNRDIMKWNGITERDVKGIKPGQKLKIKI